MCSVSILVALLTQHWLNLQDMDTAFGGDGSSVPSADTMQEAATCLHFPADLRESSAEYKYIIDLPGLSKSEIKVSLVV